MTETVTIEKQVWESTLHRSMVLQAENDKLKEYERIVTSYNMKPIDYDIACETVNKLLDERKAFKKENAQLKELLKEWMQFGIEENPNDFTVMSERMSELANKTKEVLK